jgi:uncharacterized protein YkwD
LREFAALLMCVLALAGCPSPSGGQPSWRAHRHHPTRTIGFHPAGDPSEAYNDPAITPAPESSLGDAIVAAVNDVAQEKGKNAPQPDGRLFAVAADLAGIMEQDGLPPYQAVEFSLGFHGVIEPSPHLIVVSAAAGQEESAVAAVREKLPEVIASGSFARVGVGMSPRADGQQMIVVALLESGLDTNPIARRVAKGGATRVEGKLHEPYVNAAVFVTRLDGHVDRPPVVREEGGGFRADVACGDGEGQRQIEITGDGSLGVTVLANFSIWCGDDPPRDVVLPAPGDEPDVKDANDAEQRIFDEVNEDRHAAGLPPLIWSDAAATIARGHSQDMHDHNFVGHVSPTTGSAADRTRRAGLGTPLVLENVARAFSPSEAEVGFMNSPGHRANLLSAEATHIGIGVVLGEAVSGSHELYVTQLFYRVPPKIDRKEALKVAREGISEKRTASGVKQLSGDSELDAIAQRLADGLAHGDGRDELEARSNRELDAVGDRYSNVTTILSVVGDAADVGNTDGVDDGGAQRYGLGIAQGRDPQMGENAIFVVIIMGRAR